MLAACDIMGFIPTVDAARARRFYIDTLRLDFVSQDEFALVVRANGIDIRITSMDAFNPAPYTILGWKVPDIEAAMQQLSASGVVFERYPFLQQDIAGIWTAPGGTKVAWFKDLDHNVLSISQPPAQ